MKNVFSVPRGTSDILPEGIAKWRRVEAEARKLMQIYGYREIRTPIFEETELFARSVGQTSDIVQKQILNLATQTNGEDARDMKAGTLSLRPEGTAAIVRSYIENGLARKEKLSKLFYIGPMFRGERPQKGRLRQFHQIGVEAIGAKSASPYLDAEVIGLSVELLKAFGVEDFVLKINTLGTREDKETFAGVLRGSLQNKIADLCPDCQSRYERNVLRVLDCKNKGCRSIVKNLNFWENRDYLSPESKKYFDEVKAALMALGIKFKEDPCLVRGLDYYTHVVFELSCRKLGSQDALGAGGRYNNLVDQLGGPQVDAIGFALGIERILLAFESGESDSDQLDVFLIALEKVVLPRAFQVLSTLRCNQISTDMRFSSESLKSQMRQANKANARFAVIIGGAEIEKGAVVFKDMDKGTQEEISLENLDELINKIKGSG